MPKHKNPINDQKQILKEEPKSEEDSVSEKEAVNPHLGIITKTLLKLGDFEGSNITWEKSPFLYYFMFFFISSNIYLASISFISESALIVYFLINYLNVTANFFNYISNYNIEYFLNNYQTPSVYLPIISIISGLSAYFYFLYYIKSKGIQLFDVDKKENRSFISLISGFSIFNSIIFLFLFIFLLFEQRYIELIFVILAYIQLFMITYVAQFSIVTLFDYKSLLILNSNKMPSNYYSLKYFVYKKIIKAINVDYFNEFSNINYKYNQISFVKYIGKRVPKLQTNITVLTFIFALIGLAFSFNIITMIYIEVALIVSYCFIGILRHLPNYLATIYPEKANTLFDVFIIEESPKDNIVIIDGKNKRIKLAKGKIIKTELNFNFDTYQSKLDTWDKKRKTGNDIYNEITKNYVEKYNRLLRNPFSRQR